MRRAAKVDISQPLIVEALRAHGDYVAIIGRPVDLLIRSGKVYWSAEIKTPGGNQKREQPAQTLHNWDAVTHGAPHYKLMSVDEALAARRAVLLRSGNAPA